MELNRKFLEDKYGKSRLKRLKEIELKKSGVNKIKPNAFKIRKHILDFKGLNTKLETLNINNNDISEIEEKTFHYLPNLKQLDISNNKLERFNSNKFKSKQLIKLEILNLKNNKLEKISFKNLSNLKELYLNDNKLNSIKSDTFEGLLNLTVLNLENNNIQNIVFGSFASLTSLKVLKLNNNKLKEIYQECFEPLQSIEVIQLYENELNVRSFFSESTKLSVSFYDVDRLNKHGFLSNWKDFLEQFPMLIDEIVSISKVINKLNKAISKQPDLSDNLIERVQNYSSRFDVEKQREIKQRRSK